MKKLFALASFASFAFCSENNLLAGRHELHKEKLERFRREQQQKNENSSTNHTGQENADTDIDFNKLNDILACTGDEKNQETVPSETLNTDQAQGEAVNHGNPVENSINANECTPNHNEREVDSEYIPPINQNVYQTGALFENEEPENIPPINQNVYQTGALFENEEPNTNSDVLRAILESALNRYQGQSNNPNNDDIAETEEDAAETQRAILESLNDNKNNHLASEIQEADLEKETLESVEEQMNEDSNVNSNQEQNGPAHEINTIQLDDGNAQDCMICMQVDGNGVSPHETGHCNIHRHCAVEYWKSKGFPRNDSELPCPNCKRNILTWVLQFLTTEDKDQENNFINDPLRNIRNQFPAMVLMSLIIQRENQDRQHENNEEPPHRHVAFVILDDSDRQAHRNRMANRNARRGDNHAQSENISNNNNNEGNHQDPFQRLEEQVPFILERENSRVEETPTHEESPTHEETKSAKNNDTISSKTFIIIVVIVGCTVLFILILAIVMCVIKHRPAAATESNTSFTVNKQIPQNQEPNVFSMHQGDTTFDRSQLNQLSSTSLPSEITESAIEVHGEPLADIDIQEETIATIPVEEESMPKLTVQEQPMEAVSIQEEPMTEISIV